MPSNSFGEIMHTYRTKILSRVTQARLAEFVGVGQPHLNRIEKGTILPTPQLATKLMERLLVPPDHEVEFLLQAAGYSQETINMAINNLVEHVVYEGESYTHQSILERWELNESESRVQISKEMNDIFPNTPTT